MTQVTLSSKYQVVIPKDIRKKLKVKPGQKIGITYNEKRKEVALSTKSPIEELQGMFAGKKIWGEDPAKTIRKMRDEWDD